MIANSSLDGHVDYFERALDEVCPQGYVEILHMELPEQYRRTAREEK